MQNRKRRYEPPASSGGGNSRGRGGAQKRKSANSRLTPPPSQRRNLGGDGGASFHHDQPAAQNYGRRSFPPPSFGAAAAAGWNQFAPPPPPPPNFASLREFANASGDQILPPPPLIPNVRGGGRNLAAPKRRFNQNQFSSPQNHRPQQDDYLPQEQRRDAPRKTNLPYKPHRRPASKEPGELIELSSGDEAVEDEAVEEESFVEEEEDELQIQLREALGLSPSQVPDYVLRMRELGPMGYPPALIDQHVRVNEALPFYGGTVDSILPKRKVAAENLPPFRGFTHLDGGRRVDPQFVIMMERLAQSDLQQSQQDAMNRSGIEEFRVEDDEILIDRRKSSEVIHYEIPAYDKAESSGYAFASNTKKMKHTLEGFADGIQPFEHQNPNEPTFFMKTLRGILGKKAPSKLASAASGDAKPPNEQDEPIEIS